MTCATFSWMLEQFGPRTHQDLRHMRGGREGVRLESLVALPLGGIAMTKKYQGHGMAITGVVTAVLSLCVAIAMIASFSN